MMVTLKNTFHIFLKRLKKAIYDWLQTEGSIISYNTLDQFSRHIYRNRKAYKNDPKVLLFMEMALDRYLKPIFCHRKNVCFNAISTL